MKGVDAKRRLCDAIGVAVEAAAGLQAGRKRKRPPGRSGGRFLPARELGSCLSLAGASEFRPMPKA